MELGLFDQTAELVRAMIPDQLSGLRVRSHRRGVKVWFGPEKPTKLHYEAQVIPHHLVPAAPAGSSAASGPTQSSAGAALEVGFHAEHGDERRNSAVLAQLAATEATWRPKLGPSAQVGPFLGNEHWGRLSETWNEPDIEDPDVAFELASRLLDYIETIQPLLPTDDQG